MDGFNQIALLNFENTNIQIYGTINEPLFKRTDIVNHLLGYKDISAFKPYQNLDQDELIIYTSRLEGCEMLTEQGLYWALMVTKKPIGKKFKIIVCNWIKQERLKQQQLKNQQEQLIEEQKKQIEAFEAMKKRGVIYEIFYKLDQNENYIGSHQGIDPKERFKTHINGALSSLKLPLYRRIFMEGLKQFGMRDIQFVDYHNADELLEQENKIIEDKNPSLNRGYLFECHCGKELTQERAVLKHRNNCQLYIKNPYSDPEIHNNTHI